MLVIDQSNKGFKQRPVYPEKPGLIFLINVVYPLCYHGLEYVVEGFWILEPTDLFLIALPEESCVKNFHQFP